MNRIECLKDKLYGMGCNKAQVESKVVAKTVAILADNPELLAEFEIASAIENWKTKLKKAAEEYSRRMFIYEPLKKDIDELMEKKREMKADLSAFEYYQKVEDRIAETQEYLDKFFECIKNGETAEGRDTLRKAQLFIDTVDVETKYDNTAFILGLSAILSNGKCDVLEEIKKINPVFEKPKMYAKQI